MKYTVDMHTHTIVSGHAYSTLFENIDFAAKNGIELLGNTEHGPAMGGSPHIYYFANQGVLPRVIKGVTLLRGCEANIIDYDGNLDIPEWILPKMDIIIASLHDVTIKKGNKEDHTNAILNAMNNPYVDIIGHPGNKFFPIYEEEIVKMAKAKGVLIEINNGSFVSRPGSKENCTRIAQLCKQYEVPVILGSDAHVCFQVGVFDKAEEILKEINMPDSLIINNDKNKLIKFLKNKGKLADIKLDNDK